MLAINYTCTEGLRALYKGMAPPLISLTILNTTTFTMYSEIRTKYRANVGFDISNGLAGATTAPFAAIVSTVENFIKVIGSARMATWLFALLIIRPESNVFQNKLLATHQDTNATRQRIKEAISQLL